MASGPHAHFLLRACYHNKKKMKYVSKETSSFMIFKRPLRTSTSSGQSRPWEAVEQRGPNLWPNANLPARVCSAELHEVPISAGQATAQPAA